MWKTVQIPVRSMQLAGRLDRMSKDIAKSNRKLAATTADSADGVRATGCRKDMTALPFTNVLRT